MLFYCNKTRIQYNQFFCTATCRGLLFWPFLPDDALVQLLPFYNEIIYFKLNYVEGTTYRVAIKLNKFEIKTTCVNMNNLRATLTNIKKDINVILQQMWSSMLWTKWKKYKKLDKTTKGNRDTGLTIYCIDNKLITFTSFTKRKCTRLDLLEQLEIKRGLCNRELAINE